MSVLGSWFLVLGLDLLSELAPYLAVLLAGVGAYTVLAMMWRGVRKIWWAAVRRWVWPGIARRHEVACKAMNRTWGGKLVRHAASGRIGLCQGVCIRNNRTIWGQLRARWTADVVLHPMAARTLSRGTEVPTLVFIPWAPGLREAIALRELTIAPAQDAAAFRAQMEEAS